MMKDTDKQGNLVSREQAQAFISSITPDMVLSVYSGRPGCMCGCLGNHRYNPAFKDEAGKDRGYAVDDEDCSTRSISITLNKLKRLGAELQDGYIIHFRDERHQYAAYVRQVHALGA